ncbi:MAG: PDZ domain-containing protein, partial [Planctomycetota bacterium]|nr:PDZ domain-containing protein [Planctomycetota bacterium]
EAEGSGNAKAETKETILTALQRLGKIIDVVALEPPYTNVYPTITFQFNADQKTKILRLGEALVTKKKGPLDLPHQYQFIGCKLDRADPDVVYFWFKMRADGDDKQWLKWRAEPKLQHTYVTAGDDTREFSTSIKGNNGVFRADADLATILADLPDVPETGKGGESTDGATDAGGEAEGDAATDAKKGDADPNEAETMVTAVADPVPADQPRLFDRASRSGRFEPTEEGVAHLGKNFKNIIKDIQTATYKDKKTGKPKGLRVRRIRKNSIARQFGIQEEDVILSVNGQRVTSRSQTISVVRGEVKNKKTTLTVKILRHGREITQTYDTRDPKARRAARDFSRRR